MAVRSLLTPQSTSARLILLIVLCLGLTVATTSVLKIGLEAAIGHWEWFDDLLRVEHDATAEAAGAAYSYDLGRASRRYLLLVTLAVFWTLRRWVPWRSLARRGLHRPRWPGLRFGIVLGGSLTVLYAALQLGAGLLTWTIPTPIELLEDAIEFAVGATFIALLEEIFFRGIVFRAMLRDWGLWLGITVSSAVFAVLHCISGGYRVTPGIDLTVGFRIFAEYFIEDGSLVPDLRLMVGLFLLGVVHIALYLRTGSLWAPIGTHGALVLFSKLTKILFHREQPFPEWLFGDPIFIVSGVACWGLLLVALAATHLAPAGPLTRRRTRTAL
jgi:membrane protease YdiL (CAAX protease family)